MKIKQPPIFQTKNDFLESQETNEMGNSIIMRLLRKYQPHKRDKIIISSQEDNKEQIAA
tara:strand:+ start:1183 stop:1359 length:177 start_codon:yes stop_codon:yes gene_type:complete